MFKYRINIFMLIVISVFLILITIKQSIGAIDPHTYIPKKAYALVPVIKDQVNTYFSTFPKPYYIAGLIEQESCVSLTSTKCFDPTAELNTSRELGVGIGQITKAYDKNGKVRFDSLEDMVRIHKAELSEVNWNNVRTRPDIQVRMIILMTKDNDSRLFNIKDRNERIMFTDMSYNAGLNTVFKRRRLCGLTKGCDPQKWFGNVENMCTTGTTLIYGQTACEISNKHVFNVVNIRMNKYEKLFR